MNPLSRSIVFQCLPASWFDSAHHDIQPRSGRMKWMIKSLPATLLLALLITTPSATHAQEIGLKKWNAYLQRHHPEMLRPPVRRTGATATLPATGSGLVIYGTPNFITNFAEVQYTGGSFKPAGGVDPGINYVFGFGRYSIQANGNPNITTIISGQVFATAGGMSGASPGLSPSMNAGLAIGFSQYAQVGWGYDLLQKHSFFVIGASLPLITIAQGVTASIFWVKAE